MILTPQAMTDPTATAEGARQARPHRGQARCWPPGWAARTWRRGPAILREAGIPTFAYPDTACVLFNHLWRYADNLRSLYETPRLPVAPERGEFREEVDRIIAEVSAEGRTLLTEYESKEVLAAYGIPITDTELAQTPDEAVAAAEAIGYPVVAKLLSRTITHKTDVGGVVLNLRTADAVREAFEKIQASVTEKKGAEHFEGVTVQPMVNWTGYELILGSSIDPQFGPVLLFGMGGQLVELFRDRALALPPLNTTLARHLIDETKIATALQRRPGRKPIDKEVLAALLVRFSQLVAEQPRIAEIDINPLLASPERLIALDARVVLHPASVADADLPRLAIRPYPHEYLREAATDDGTPIIVRPIRPEDEPAVARFHAGLSSETVRRATARTLALAERTAHERLTRICFVDYDRQFALVAERAVGPAGRTGRPGRRQPGRGAARSRPGRARAPATAGC